MNKTLNVTMETLVNFDLYEISAFCGFLLVSMCALIDGDYFYSFAVMIGCVWVFTSSGYRQDCDFFISIIEGCGDE